MNSGINGYFIFNVTLVTTPFNGGFNLFEICDSKVNFFPKKFNRISHAIPRDNSLAIPREFDDMQWPF